MTATMTMTIYHPDHGERTLDNLEARRELHSGGGWSAVKPPPAGWEKEVPKYKVQREVHPPLKDRFRQERPLAHCSDSSEWQYATRTHHAGEILETTSWPHPSFMPLNYSAQRVLEFFNSRQKSRLQLSPWHGGQVRLDDGLTGPVDVRPVTPRSKPMDLRPVA
jgi:hypothetical protein